MSYLSATGKYVSAVALERGASVLAARQAPASPNPKLREDLLIRRQVNSGEVTWLVRNPDDYKLTGYPDAAWELISLFDGTRSMLGIVEAYNEAHPGDEIDLALVVDLEDDLRRKGLIAQSTAERNLALLEKLKNSRNRAAEEKAEGFNPMLMQFPLVDPDRFLNRTVKYVRWIWSPPMVAVSSVFFLLTAGVFVANWDFIWRETVELYSLFKKPLLDFLQFYLVFTTIAAMHEYSHAYAVKIFGGEVHEIGAAFLYFMPAFYCDTTDSYLFESRWHKLWVYTAGIYTEMILCVIATGIWLASYPDTLIHEIAYKTMLYTGVSTVFFNSNPLVMCDGYNILAHLLDIPTLRQDSFRFIGTWLQRNILRLNVQVPVVSRFRRRVYVIYGTLALGYLTMVMYFIGWLFNHLYSKVFPDFAVVLLILTLYKFFQKRIRLFTSVVKLFYLDKKELLMSPRVRTPLIAAGIVVVLALVVPWSRRTVEAPIRLDPATTLRMDAPVTALVSSVAVGEGELVRAGQPLVLLVSPPLETRIAELSAAVTRQTNEAKRLLALGDARGSFAAEREKDAVAAELSAAEAERVRLRLDSPIAGRILTRRPQDLVGRVVVAGTPLLLVGDCRRMTAEVPVTERLLTDLAPGQAVAAQLAALPARIVRGTLRSVAPATLERQSEGSGPLRASAMPARFVALAEFENADATLVPGMAGVAKVYSERTSFAARAGRTLWRWVRSIAW